MPRNLEALQKLVDEIHHAIDIRIVDAIPVPGVMNNNQLYQLITDDGRSFVAKFYFKDERKRREREYPFLKLLADQGFTNVPRPLYESIDLDCGVYQWIEGMRKKQNEYTKEDMLDLADFVARIHNIDVSLGRELLDAQMAAFSMKDLRHNIEKRIQWIEEDLSKKAFHPDVVAFLDRYQSLSRVQEALRNMQYVFGDEVSTYLFPESYKRISSVDFGPHNTLFPSNGSPVYLDFENAGIDHPLRTVIDVVNHQKTEMISSELKRSFVDRYREHAQLPEEMWNWFEPMRRFGLIEWHLLHLTQLRPAKLNQFKFALTNEVFDEQAFIEEKLGLATRTLDAMLNAENWFS